MIQLNEKIKVLDIVLNIEMVIYFGKIYFHKWVTFLFEMIQISRVLNYREGSLKKITERVILHSRINFSELWYCRWLVNLICRQTFVKFMCMFCSMVVKIDFSWVDIAKIILLKVSWRNDIIYIRMQHLCESTFFFTSMWK